MGSSSLARRSRYSASSGAFNGVQAVAAYMDDDFNSAIPMAALADDPYHAASAPPSAASPLSLAERRRAASYPEAHVGLNDRSFNHRRGRRNALGSGLHDPSMLSPTSYTQPEVAAYFHPGRRASNEGSFSSTSITSDEENDDEFFECDLSHVDRLDNSVVSLASPRSPHDSAADELRAADNWSAVPETSSFKYIKLLKQRLLHKGSAEATELTVCFSRLGELLSQMNRSQLNLDEAVELASYLRARLAQHFSSSARAVPDDIRRAMDLLGAAAQKASKVDHFRQGKSSIKRLQEQREALHYQRLKLDRKLRKNKRYQPYLEQQDENSPSMVLPDTSSRTMKQVNKLRAAITRYEMYTREVEAKANRVLAASEIPPPCVAELQDAEFQLLHLFRVYIGQFNNRNPASTELYRELWGAFTKIMQHA